MFDTLFSVSFVIRINFNEEKKVKRFQTHKRSMIWTIEFRAEIKKHKNCKEIRFY